MTKYVKAYYASGWKLKLPKDHPLAFVLFMESWNWPEQVTEQDLSLAKYVGVPIPDKAFVFQKEEDSDKWPGGE